MFSGTLTKRSVSRNQRAPQQDSLVRDYSCKRWLMLSLLSVEIDMFVTWLCPLDLDTRYGERLLSQLYLMTNFRDLVAAQLGREAARQLDDVIKRREDVRLKTADKKWREYARSQPKYFVKYF